MRHRWLCLFILLCLAAAPAGAQEPPLQIENAASVGELRREAGSNRFDLTVTVISTSATTETIGLRQEIDSTRFEVLGAHADNGTAEIVYVKAQGKPDRAVALRWFGSAWLDHPVTVYVQLLVRADAPPGNVSLPVAGSNAAGYVAGDSLQLRVCCVAQPPPARRIFFPIARR